MPLSSPVSEAERILHEAESRGVVLRLIGGTAFYMRCPSSRTGSLQRSYVDVDLVGHSKQAREIKRLFSELGYTGRDRFNAMQGDRRLIFNDLENSRRVDIFLDVFEMCHRFNLKDRLEVDAQTIPLADLLATKLQIVELNEKDMKDILSVLLDHELGHSDGDTVNVDHLAGLCGDDWGIYKTLTTSLDKASTAVAEGGLTPGQKELLEERIGELRRAIEEAPKSFKWKMRARVGEKVRWYLLPEADKEVVDSRKEAQAGEAH